MASELRRAAAEAAYVFLADDDGNYKEMGLQSQAELVSLLLSWHRAGARAAIDLLNQPEETLRVNYPYRHPRGRNSVRT